jgi:hypothetical protein
MQLLSDISRSEIVAWTALATAILTGLAGIVKAIFDGFKSLRTDTAIKTNAETSARAEGKADIINSRVDATAAHVQSVDRQVTEIAAAMPSTVIVTSPAAPQELVGAPVRDVPKG